MPGYSPAAAAVERATEAAAAARPDSARARRASRTLSSEVHIAGTPADRRTRDYVLDAMRQMGLATQVRTYEVWMPQTTQVQLWRVAPDTLALPLAEGPVPEDTTSWSATEPIIANGYSGTGDVTGKVVYVNYGLIADYARLDSIGVSVRGAIVVARYGTSYRGIKAREAEKQGAIGLILYNDPQDDGYVVGDVYPRGPMRPASGVERGSILMDDGDPSTPGYPSRPGAPRIPVAAMHVAHIPVIPISYLNATALLRGLDGAEVARGWQGGLPFRYHTGPGPVAAHVIVRSDTGTAAFKHIWDTFGVMRGTEFPDELVIIGAHRDAWGPGAADNVSGTVSVLEAARAITEEATHGRGPKRTIIFATWDAEEWGESGLGSTEYVEDDSLRLARWAVAYLNQDVAVQGRYFRVSASPSLAPTLRDIVAHVRDPGGAGSIYDGWRRTAAVADSAEPPVGDLGGGTDYGGFYNHLGIPAIDWGFDAADGVAGGVYHSLYDSYHWMATFGDPTYAYHATAAAIGATLLLRLANADVLPYDYAAYARTMRRNAHGAWPASTDTRWNLSVTALDDAMMRMERAAVDFNRVRDSILARGTPAPRTVRATNAALRRVERALTRPAGLRTRPWLRNLIYAADYNDGYASTVFPSVIEAIRDGDRTRAEGEIADLTARFDTATAAIAAAAFALRSTGR
jgi:N-acetylated-alpha-linked acidic dipeptidase